MTLNEMKELFEIHNDSFLKFEEINEKNHKHPRRDICAFLIIDGLQQKSNSSIISGAQHDKIWIDGDLEKIAELIDNDTVIDLIRCGIFIDEGSFAMFG